MLCAEFNLRTQLTSGIPYDDMIWHTETKKNALKPDIRLMANKDKKEKLSLEEHQPPRLTDLLRLYWQKYCEKSSIHGVRYIYDPTLRSIERLIWTALVITCITLTCIAYFLLAERYSSQKLQTVVENSQYPVFKIPFPAVAVCTNNRINWQKFEEAKAKFLPPKAEQSIVDIFTTFVERMESMRFRNFKSFVEMDDINLEVLDKIDITNLTKFLSIRCEDIFVNGTCHWRRVVFDCCSGFILERTDVGYCLVFNSIMSPDSLEIRNTTGIKYYPYHTSKAGQGTGLNFVLKVNDSLQRPKSKLENTVTIIVKRPTQLSSNGYTITPQTETYFIVRPEITESDENIRPLSHEKRNCFFKEEIDVFYYNKTSQIDRELIRGNCLSACHEEHLRKYCNCTLPLFFLASDQSAETCRASHFRCLAKHNEIFSYDKRQEEDAYFSAAKPGMTCPCLVQCNTIEYFTSLSTLPLTDDDSCNKTDFQTFEIDVHYQSEVVIRYRTSLEFTSIDLIANFGGIFGLCLGASMVSAVELLYYLTFGLGLYLYDNNYYAVLIRKFRDLKTHLRNYFTEEYDETAHIKRKSSFPTKRPHLKQSW